MKKKQIAITLGIMCLLLTIALCVQIRTMNSAGSTVSQTLSDNDLRDQVLRMKERYDNATRELQSAQKRLEEVRQAATQNDSEAEKKERELKGKSLIEDLNNYTVVDIETTGMSWNFSKILEISALKVRNKEITEEFSELINPHEPIPYFIKNLTGITDEMVCDALELDEVLLKFKDFLREDIIVGHNVNFDVNFLYDNFLNVLNNPMQNNFVDTLRISRKLLPELKHHKLDNLTQYYNIKARDKHRALNDCVLTNKVYIDMCKTVYEKYDNWDSFKKEFRI